MPTSAARAQAIADGLLNKTATPAQINRLGLALAFQCGMVTDYNAMTQAGKAAFLVERIRSHVVGLVKRYDESAASVTAVAPVSAAVDAEFAEA